MQIDQRVRRATSGAGGLIGRLLGALLSGFGRAIAWLWRILAFNVRGMGVRQLVQLVSASILVVILYYVAGSIWLSKVDADIGFNVPSTVVPPQSRAVAIASALLDREVNKNGWTPNDPFYKPTFILDNMPNFQKGMMLALARFGTELQDQLGRTRGSSQIDPDLEIASGQLRYSTDRWVWNPSDRWWALNVTSEDSYRRAIKALEAYNGRLATGGATFERRADNLRATLDRMALDLGSTSAVIDSFLRDEAGFPWHWRVDDVFYNTKGQLYANYMILRELRTDFADLLRERRIDSAFDQMLESLKEAVLLQPTVILNASPDAQFFPNHVAAQGFYLLRARTQLREITNILQT